MARWKQDTGSRVWQERDQAIQSVARKLGPSATTSLADDRTEQWLAIPRAERMTSQTLLLFSAFSKRVVFTIEFNKATLSG